MKRSILVVTLGLAAVLLLWAERDRYRDHPPFEVKCVYPIEVAPAQFKQVDPRELEALADQGWELVSVMPYIYRNEERGNDVSKPKPMVTISYPAYFFKRTKTMAAR